MPDLFLIEEDSPSMTERLIDLGMLSRIDSEQKATASRVDILDTNLQAVALDVSQIKTKTEAPNTPWWVTSIIAPLCVAGVVGACVALITLLVKVNGIETFIRDNGGVIAGLRLQNVSPQKPKEAEQILIQAKKTKTKISAEVIETAGAKFISVAKDTPDAWTAALTFLDYRSFLNADFVPSVGRLTTATGKSRYSSTIATRPNPDYPGTQRALSLNFAGGYAPSDKSARMERLDDPQPQGSEFAFFVINGGVDAVVLDGEYLKHVIIRNSEVVYDGGQLRLEDVYFVNCTFHSSFKLTPRSIDLSQRILTAASVSFSPKA